MTLARIRETRAATRPALQREDRSGGTLAGNGWGVDPAAIPPPGSHGLYRAGVQVTPYTSMQIDVVYTCLRVISNAIIKLGDLRAYTEGLNDDNIVYRIWESEQPGILTSTFGPYQMQYDGRRRTVMSLGLYGEAFWYVVTRDGLGFPEAIEVLNPAFMKVEASRDGSGRPVYTYGTGSKRVELDADDVIHIPFMAMPGAQRGLSSVEYAGVSYALALAAVEYGERWFSQGASPSFILSTEQKLGTEEVERIASKFLIEHSGLQAAHLPLVVDKGLGVTKIQSSPDEAQYLQTLEYSRSCIAAWFGLPSHLAGGDKDKGNVWGRTVQEQSMQFLQWTLSGYTVPLEEAHGLLVPSDIKTAFDDSKLSRPDATSLAAEIMSLRQTQVATQNDIRVRKLQWPPIEGGDEILAPLASNIAPSNTPSENFSDVDSSGDA